MEKKVLNKQVVWLLDCKVQTPPNKKPQIHVPTHIHSAPYSIEYSKGKTLHTTTTPPHTVAVKSAMPSLAPSCSCSRVPGCATHPSAATTSGRVFPPRRVRCAPHVQANAVPSGAATKTHDQLESVLYSCFKAHDKSLTAALILHDSGATRFQLPISVACFSLDLSTVAGS